MLCVVLCQPTSAATSTTSTIFPVWHNAITTSSTNSTYTANIWPTWQTIELTDEQYQCLVRQQEEQARIVRERQRQWEDDDKKRQEAEERAQDLLLECLTEEQRKTVKEHKWFVVKGGKSGKTYRIRTNTVAGNVEELEEEKATSKFCCHLNHKMPRPDHHLAQKMMLEYDEDEFLRVANRTRLG